MKTCILERLNEGGRNEEEARKWCVDYLALKEALGPNVDEATACDSANLREAERVFLDTKIRLKPWYMDKCVATRQRLFGEPEYEAAKRCKEDFEMSERVRGNMVVTDAASVHQFLDPPESFHKLAVLELQLDRRTEEFENYCTPEEADKRARKELGLPRVFPKRKPEPDATMPEVFGKTREQRLKELAVDTQRRPGERLISPFSGVPPLYGKNRKQVLDEVYEMDQQDRENRSR
ncbi:hypothetical protein MUP79_10095 [Candidatus Bathyarchaeota archaeon]|nr:hypothetical protein [Candidatus Bathyarchaeota archaeon]